MHCIVGYELTTMTLIDVPYCKEGVGETCNAVSALGSGEVTVMPDLSTSASVLNMSL
jgi:hypothetical protein